MISLYPLQNVVMTDFANLMRVKYFVVLICIPLLVRLNIFTCLMTINLLTVKYLLISFTHFSIWLFANIIYIYIT